MPRRRYKTKQPQTPTLVPFTPQQRNYLIRQSAFCAAASLLLLVTACFFVGVSLDPLSPSGSLLWLPALAASLALALVGWYGVRYALDLQAGGSLQQVARLEEVVRRSPYRSPIRYRFVTIGYLGRPQGDRRHLDLNARSLIFDEDVGKQQSITYSPHSRLLWTAVTTSASK